MGNFTFGTQSQHPHQKTSKTNKKKHIIMNILSIDPGKLPGYAILNTDCLIERHFNNTCFKLPVVISAACEIDKLPFLNAYKNSVDAIAIESQWLADVKKKESILKLAAAAGWQAAMASCECHNASVYWVPPVSRDKCRGWREALSFVNEEKLISQNRVFLTLISDEKRLLNRLGNKAEAVLDSIMIGWGFFMLRQKQLVTQWPEPK
jgi:hypothetical protein